MTRTAIVLGAGMVGVATALHLQRRGWSVALVDRQPPGQATSYGNAGIIQSEAVEPYAMPRDWRKLLAVAMGRTNDVRYRARSLHRHAGPLLRYWWHSAPSRHQSIAAAYAALIRTAASEHADLIEAAGVRDIVRKKGFHVLYRTDAAMNEAVAEADRLRVVYGVRYEAMTPTELLAAEPVLRTGGAGAIHWTEPWSVSDPGGLVAAYAELFRGSGGAIATGDAATFRRSGSRWTIATQEGGIDAEHAVVALGPWAPALLRRFGIRISMVLKRGYHRHWNGPHGLRRPLMDAANGYVLAPMTGGMRITTGAELTGFDAAIDTTQLRHAEAAADGLVDLGSPVEAEPWFGTRPCMPDMLPAIGLAPGRHDLWLNSGHGHQGFTLGPTSGRLLAELMSGEEPHVSPAPYRLDRPRHA